MPPTTDALERSFDPLYGRGHMRRDVPTLSKNPSMPHCDVDLQRILIHVKNKSDRHQLEDWLSERYEIVSAHTEDLLKESFDVGILDGPSLKQLYAAVRGRRRE